MRLPRFARNDNKGVSRMTSREMTGGSTTIASLRALARDDSQTADISGLIVES